MPDYLAVRFYDPYSFWAYFAALARTDNLGTAPESGVGSQLPPAATDLLTLQHSFNLQELEYMQKQLVREGVYCGHGRLRPERIVDASKMKGCLCLCKFFFEIRRKFCSI